MDSAINFQRIVETIRQCSVKEIRAMEQVMKKVAEDHEGDKLEARKLSMLLFHDSLSVAATRNSLFVLSDKIMKSEIPTVKIVQLLKAFTANQHSPSTRQADILERIAKHEVN